VNHLLYDIFSSCNFFKNMLDLLVLFILICGFVGGGHSACRGKAGFLLLRLSRSC